MNMKKFVPDLELCRHIPAGEFEDSTCIWVNGLDNKPKVILRPWDKKSINAPAPIVQEILIELAKITLFPEIVHNGTYWTAVCSLSDGANVIQHSSADNPANAAMQCWLTARKFIEG